MFIDYFALAVLLILVAAAVAIWVVLGVMPGRIVALVFPMQWGAPSGPVNVFRFVIEIVPNVSGEVVDVPVKPLELLKKGPASNPMGSFSLWMKRPSRLPNSPVARSALPTFTLNGQNRRTPFVVLSCE